MQKLLTAVVFAATMFSQSLIAKDYSANDLADAIFGHLGDGGAGDYLFKKIHKAFPNWSEENVKDVYETKVKVTGGKLLVLFRHNYVLNGFIPKDLGPSDPLPSNLITKLCEETEKDLNIEVSNIEAGIRVVKQFIYGLFSANSYVELKYGYKNAGADWLEMMRQNPVYEGLIPEALGANDIFPEKLADKICKVALEDLASKYGVGLTELDLKITEVLGLTSLIFSYRYWKRHLSVDEFATRVGVCLPDKKERAARLLEMIGKNIPGTAALIPVDLEADDELPDDLVQVLCKYASEKSGKNITNLLSVFISGVMQPLFKDTIPDKI